MKKMKLLTALITGLFMINTVKAQKHNYISIETGFGDFDSFILLGNEFGGQYPRKSNDGGKLLIRLRKRVKE